MAGLSANVIILALCQALAGTSTVLGLAIMAIVGTQLAPDDRLATLPVTLQTLGTMAALFPASLIMKWRGRAIGFAIGAILGLLAGVLASEAIQAGSFILYCLAAAAHGAFIAFAQFYRFAAAEAAQPMYRGRAISLVIAGGVAAGVVGPELAVVSSGWIPNATYAGGHLLAGILAGFSLPLLAMITIPMPPAEERRRDGRPLVAIMLTAPFLVAAAAATLGYAAMSLIMTVTPLAVVAHDHGFADAAWVIQWHVIAMFAPGFFTGWIIDRIGVMRVVAIGAVAILVAAAVNLLGEDLVANFWLGLVLLGVGWNFMYVGGTTLLTEAYRLAEKAKVQAANDFLVYLGVAIATLSSGALFHSLGWSAVNWGVTPLILVVLAAALFAFLRRAR